MFAFYLITSSSCEVDSLLSEESTITHPHFLARCEYTLSLLAGYAHALAPIHRDMLPLNKPFRYGM